AANRSVEARKLSGLVRGELDWIVMKALEKERASRYETASALAEDIERYLRDEPVQACPPSAFYQARKLVRRHRRTLVVGGLLALGAIAGSIGWIAHDRSTQRRLQVQELLHALTEVEDGYQGDKLVNALAALKRAEGLAASPGVDAELRRRVQQWRTDLELAV